MARSLTALTSIAKKNSLFSYALWIMTLTHLLTHVFAQVHTTLFPTLQIEFSLSLQQLGIIAAIPPLCQTILAIPTGLLSDRIGSRKLIVASLIISALGAFLASQASGPVALIIAVSLVYINTTVYHPAAYSFVTRVFGPRDRLRALGFHGAGGTLGVAIGPLSISLIMGVLALGWRAVYLVWIIPFLLGIVAMLRVKSEPVEDVKVEPTENKTNQPVTSLLSVSLIMFLAFISVRTIANGMSQSFMALYLVDERGLSASTASLYIGLNTLMGAVAAPLGGFLAVRYGEKRWLMIVLSGAVVCFGLAIIAPSNTLFVILYLAFGFLTFLGMAANSAMMAQLSPGKQRGLAYALFFLPGSIMGVVAPIIAASIAEAYNLAAVLYASVAIYVVSIVVLKFGVKVQDS